jgi:hypothetical protein
VYCDLCLQVESIASAESKTELLAPRAHRSMVHGHSGERQASLSWRWALCCRLQIVRIYSRLPGPSDAVEVGTLTAARSSVLISTSDRGCDSIS